MQIELGLNWSDNTTHNSLKQRHSVKEAHAHINRRSRQCLTFLLRKWLQLSVGYQNGLRLTTELTLERFQPSARPKVTFSSCRALPAAGKLTHKCDNIISALRGSRSRSLRSVKKREWQTQKGSEEGKRLKWRDTGAESFWPIWLRSYQRVTRRVTPLSLDM